MKKYLIVIIVLCCMLFVGCKKAELQEIKDEEIFMMEGEAYYIFFYRDGCTACERTLPYVLDYLDTISRNSKRYENCRYIYGVNLKKGGESSKIFRTYVKDNGEGTDGKYFVTGVKEWDDLYIATTPALISIYVDSSGVKQAKYLAQGVSKIRDYLDSCLQQVINEEIFTYNYYFFSFLYYKWM